MIAETTKDNVKKKARCEYDTEESFRAERIQC